MNRFRAFFMKKRSKFFHSSILNVEMSLFLCSSMTLDWMSLVFGENKTHFLGFLKHWSTWLTKQSHTWIISKLIDNEILWLVAALLIAHSTFCVPPLFEILACLLILSRLPYKMYFGGVSALTPLHYLKMNGFPNNYWGWGGEDDDIGVRWEMLRKTHSFYAMLKSSLISYMRLIIKYLPNIRIRIRVYQHLSALLWIQDHHVLVYVFLSHNRMWLKRMTFIFPSSQSVSVGDVHHSSITEGRPLQDD